MEHDVRAVHIIDSAELNLPALGKVTFTTPDNTSAATVDTSDDSTRRDYEDKAKAHLASCKRMFKSLGIPYARLLTTTNAIEQEFFLKQTT